MSSDTMRRKTWLRVLVLVAVVLPRTAIGQQPREKPRSPSPANQFSAAFREAVEQIRPSIVFIETLGGPRELPEWSKHEASFGDDGPARRPRSATSERSPDVRRDGSGTGIVFDERGYVLTCYHVVESADLVFIRLADNRRIEAVRVLSDPFTDLAVIQIADAGQLSAAALGNSDDLRIGDWVLSVGNPYSMGLSVSAGIVSGIDRHSPLIPRTPLIQTDAASNPGNSGGALIDLDGKVVGISQGGYGTNEAFQGIGFAVPINVVKRIARQLIDQGRIKRGSLGCDTETLSSDVARLLGIDDSAGLIITNVKPQTPASEAGLQIGDVIRRLDREPIRDNVTLLSLLERAVPGSKISFSVVRERQPIEIVVRLGVLPDLPKNGRPTAAEAANQRSGYQDIKLGLTLDELSPDLANELGYAPSFKGLVISYVRPGSPASKQDLCAGMVLLRIDNDAVHKVQDFRRIMAQRSSDKEIVVLIGTPRRNHFVVLRQ